MHKPSFVALIADLSATWLPVIPAIMNDAMKEPPLATTRTTVQEKIAKWISTNPQEAEIILNDPIFKDQPKLVKIDILQAFLEKISIKNAIDQYSTVTNINPTYVQRKFDITIQQIDKELTESATKVYKALIQRIMNANSGKQLG